MSQETTSPPEAIRSEIDLQVRTVFQSIRSSLINLGLIEQYNYKPKNQPRVYSYRPTEKAYRLGDEYPWPLNTPLSACSGGDGGLYVQWPTERGKYEEIHIAYADGESPEYVRARGDLYRVRYTQEEWRKHYQVGKFSESQPGKRNEGRPATMDEWEREEKPILDKVVSSLAQGVLATATTKP